MPKETRTPLDHKNISSATPLREVIDIETNTQKFDNVEPKISHEPDTKTTVWKTDELKDQVNIQNEKQQQTVKVKEVMSNRIQDQSSIGMKTQGPRDSTPGGIYDAPDLTQVILPRKRHLLVPINVQAFVVKNKPSPMKPSKPMKQEQKNHKSDSIALIKEPSQKDQFPPRADLHIQMNRDVESQDSDNSTSKTGWGLQNPFSYVSSNPATTGLPNGIHLFWTLPKALLEGKLNENSNFDSLFSEVPVDATGYIDPDELIPTTLIPCDDGFEHPITFRDAVEHRVEFSTEDGETKSISEMFTFRQLPDLWLVVRTGLQQNQTKSWIVDAVTLEVTPLDEFTYSTRDSSVKELTATGPGDGNFFWTATYDNMKNRFTFHDLPLAGENGPFNYFVCGWYTNQSHDPIHMESSTPEDDWYDFLENELKWTIGTRSDIDIEDPDLYYAAFKMYEMMQNGGAQS